MSVRPIHIVHLLYDNESVTEIFLFQTLRNMLEELSLIPSELASIRFSLLRLGRTLNKPQEPKWFEVNDSFLDQSHIDLKAAFEQVVSDYKTMDRSMIGMKNPEILIVLCSKPANDWLSSWQEIEPYRSLILTYWINRQPMEYSTKKSLEQLLNQISLPDPTTGTPRFKIVDLPETDQEIFLQDLFSKLKGRIKDRITG